MKTPLTLNIGLQSITGTPVEIHRCINEVSRTGIVILASFVVSGEWQGKPEQTLVIQGLAYDSFELRPRLYSASRALSQYCIAIWGNGKGELIGENPQGFTFDANLFHFHREAKPVQLSDCQAIQAEHAAKRRVSRP